MQGTNLLNLPENYTFKYCAPWVDCLDCRNGADGRLVASRSLPRLDMATIELRRSQPKGPNRRIHPCQDVSRPGSRVKPFETELVHLLPVTGMRTHQTQRRVTSPRFPSCGHTGG